jgi:hypothetical protein
VYPNELGIPPLSLNWNKHVHVSSLRRSDPMHHKRCPTCDRASWTGIEQRGYLTLRASRYARSRQVHARQQNLPAAAASEPVPKRRFSHPAFRRLLPRNQPILQVKQALDRSPVE